MGSSIVSGVRVAGIACAVPPGRRTVQDEAAIFGQEAAAKISQSIGIQERRIASQDVCTSDLCFAAAERLLAELGWKSDQVAGLIFVTQTPDYILPATSHSLHRRLGLSATCYALDINLGCSGYVYGLWIAASLINTTGGKVLLLVGDTISKIASPQDQSVAFLFGDAGTATALEAAPSASPMFFELGADGSGESNLIVPAGGFRSRHSEHSATRSLRDDGNTRSDEDLFMIGPEVFSFTLKRVPGLVSGVLRTANCDLSQIDGFVFHQANRFMLDHLAKRMKIPADKFIVSMELFGNTSSASIPLTVTTSKLRDQLLTSPMRLLLAGFGVGYSWAATVLDLSGAVLPALVEYTGTEPPKAPVQDFV